MKITIYNTDSTILAEVYALGRSSQDWGIMTDNALSLEFETSQCVILPPGCYVEFDGTQFFLLEEYRPTLLNKTRWQYNVTFRDATSLLSVVAALNTIDGKNTPLMVLTAPVYEHALIVISNMNRFFGDITWAVGEIVSTENIEIDYTGKYCSDILTELCSKTDLEWWFDGYTLNIGRCEFGELLELGYMNGLLGDIECSQANNALSYAYLYPIGSTRNIDPTQYGNDRLQLPDGIVRIPMNSKGIAELVEETAFAGIYPRYVATVSAVRTEQRTNEDGTPFTIYYIADNNLPFDPNEYEIAGLVKRITFQSGELMGREFEVNFNSDTKEIEIITQFPYEDIQVPGGVLIPSIGDQFVIWNITMPIEYYTLASQEFLEVAQQFAKDTTKDTSVYKTITDYIYTQEQETKLMPGQRVRLLSDYYFPDKGYYDSRITHISRDIDKPHQVSLEISAVRSIGTLAQLAANVKSNEVVFRQLSASIPPIVKSWEEIAATDSNIYSARRSEKEFLNKRKGGVVQGATTFEKNVVVEGITTKGFVDTGIGGRGFGVTKDANGNTVVTTDILRVRKKAEFYELVINQTTFELGETVKSLAGCEITSVEEVGDVYRCFYDTKGGKKYSGFKVGDQARCQRYDASYDSIEKYYWRVVAGVGADYVDLHKSGEDAYGNPLVDGSDIPSDGDNIVHFGSRTDYTRQSAIVMTCDAATTHGYSTPAIILYEGINTFVLPEPTTQIMSGDNRFSGQVHLTAGSTGEFGKFNLLLNSGFTGDYLSKQLQGDSEINGDSEMFSPSLVHWVQRNVYAQESSESASGAEVVFLNLGMIRQTIESNIVDGDNYVLSFKAKGSSLSWSAVGQNGEVTLTSKYERYSIRLQANTDSKAVEFTSDNATICEVQLERGTIASVWGNSMWDNTSALARYQELEYMRSALKDGKTVMDGGLILSRMLALFKDAELQRMTAGVNGSYVSDDTPAFWAGGSLDAAIDTVQRFRDNPSNITDEEWSSLAKFVATHGGDVFMRGYIHALGGLFQGAVNIANGRTKFDVDGSGQFANGNISWDKDGRVQKVAPDSIKWTSISEYDNKIIDYTKGAYLDLTCENNGSNNVYDLDLAAFEDFSVIIKGTPIASQGETSAILTGMFYMPDGGIYQKLKCDYVVNGITLTAVDAGLSHWHLYPPVYKIEGDTVVVSDVQETYTGNIDIYSNGVYKTLVIKNGLIVSVDNYGA